MNKLKLCYTLIAPLLLTVNVNGSSISNIERNATSSQLDQSIAPPPLPPTPAPKELFHKNRKNIDSPFIKDMNMLITSFYREASEKSKMKLSSDVSKVIGTFINWKYEPVILKDGIRGIFVKRENNKSKILVKEDGKCWKVVNGKKLINIDGSEGLGNIINVGDSILFYKVIPEGSDIFLDLNIPIFRMENPKREWYYLDEKLKIYRCDDDFKNIFDPNQTIQVDGRFLIKQNTPRGSWFIYDDKKNKPDFISISDSAEIDHIDKIGDFIIGKSKKENSADMESHFFYLDTHSSKFREIEELRGAETLCNLMGDVFLAKLGTNENLYFHLDKKLIGDANNIFKKIKNPEGITLFQQCGGDIFLAAKNNKKNNCYQIKFDTSSNTYFFKKIKNSENIKNLVGLGNNLLGLRIDESEKTLNLFYQYSDRDNNDFLKVENSEIFENFILVNNNCIIRYPNSENLKTDFEKTFFLVTDDPCKKPYLTKIENLQKKIPIDKNLMMGSLYDNSSKSLAVFYIDQKKGRLAHSNPIKGSDGILYLRTLENGIIIGADKNYQKLSYLVNKATPESSYFATFDITLSDSDLKFNRNRSSENKIKVYFKTIRCYETKFKFNFIIQGRNISNNKKHWYKMIFCDKGGIASKKIISLSKLNLSSIDCLEIYKNSIIASVKNEDGDNYKMIEYKLDEKGSISSSRELTGTDEELSMSPLDFIKAKKKERSKPRHYTERRGKLIESVKIGNEQYLKYLTHDKNIDWYIEDIFSKYREERITVERGCQMPNRIYKDSKENLVGYSMKNRQFFSLRGRQFYLEKDYSKKSLIFIESPSIPLDIWRSLPNEILADNQTIG